MPNNKVIQDHTGRAQIGGVYIQGQQAPGQLPNRQHFTPAPAETTKPAVPAEQSYVAPDYNNALIDPSRPAPTKPITPRNDPLDGYLTIEPVAPQKTTSGDIIIEIVPGTTTGGNPGINQYLNSTTIDVEKPAPAKPVTPRNDPLDSYLTIEPAAPQKATSGGDIIIETIQDTTVGGNPADALKAALKTHTPENLKEISETLKQFALYANLKDESASRLSILGKLSNLLHPEEKELLNNWLKDLQKSNNGNYPSEDKFNEAIGDVIPKSGHSLNTAQEQAAQLMAALKTDSTAKPYDPRNPSYGSTVTKNSGNIEV